MSNQENQNAEKNSSHNNEIDFMDIFIKSCCAIGKFFRTIFVLIGRFLLHIVRIIIRHFWLICIFIGVGVVLGTIYFSLQQPKFSGEALVRCNGFDNVTLELEINKLNTIISNQNHQYLASLLNIPEATAKQISSIRMGYGIDLDDDGIVNEVSYNEQGTQTIFSEKEIKEASGEGSIFVRRVERGKVPGIAYISIHSKTLNITQFNTISNGVLFYVYNNSYLAKINRNYKIMVQDKIQVLNYQMALLDSLQRIEYIETSRKKNENSVNTDKVVFTSYQEKDKQLFHDNVLSLSDTKLNLEKSLRDDNQVITVISDFRPVLVKTGLFYLAFICGFIGLILGCVCATILENLSYIIQFIKENR